MIVKDEFLNQLRRYFSLNLYEVKIWASLLSRGISTAGELSDIADVPRSRSYDVLESLQKKGFVIMKIGKPIKYIAVSPSEVVERVKKNMKQEADEKILRLSNLKETDLLVELNSLYSQSLELIDPSDLAGALKGRRNLYNQLELSLKGAKESISMVTTSQGIIRKVDSLKPLFEKLSKKGVKIKIAAPLNKESKNALKEILNYAEIKDVNNINARFTIIDNKEVLFMTLDDKDVHPTFDTGIWVKTPYFATAMNDLFNSAWNSMKSIK